MHIISKCMVVLSLSLFSSNAYARVIQVSYFGTVADGIDTSNFFGLGRSLVGAGYEASYLFDDTRGVRTTIAPYLDSVIGGPFSGTSDPSIGATLRINGRSFRFTGSSLGLQSVYPLGSAISSYASDQSSDPFDASYIGNSLQVVGLPSSMETAFVALGSPANGGYINGFQIATGPSIYVADYASGVLAPSSVTVVVTSSVPETTSWILMVLGFTGSGAALRAARRTSVAPS